MTRENRAAGAVDIEDRGHIANTVSWTSEHRPIR